MDTIINQEEVDIPNYCECEAFDDEDVSADGYDAYVCGGNVDNCSGKPARNDFDGPGSNHTQHASLN